MDLLVHRHIHHDIFGLQLYLDFRPRQRLVGNTFRLFSCRFIWFPVWPINTLKKVIIILLHFPRTVIHVGIANPRWRGKRSRHFRCMPNPQFYVSGKRPMNWFHEIPSHEIEFMIIKHCLGFFSSLGVMTPSGLWIFVNIGWLVTCSAPSHLLEQ